MADLGFLRRGQRLLRRLLSFSFSFPFLFFSIFFLSLTPLYFLSFHGPSWPSLNSPVYWTDQLLPDPGFFLQHCEFFKGFFNICRAFSQLGLYPRSYRGSGFSWKFYHRCTLGQQSPHIFLGGLTRSLTALVYTIVNKYNKYKYFISSQYSDNQAIWLEKWGKLYKQTVKDAILTLLQ